MKIETREKVESKNVKIFHFFLSLLDISQTDKHTNNKNTTRENNNNNNNVELLSFFWFSKQKNSNNELFL